MSSPIVLRVQNYSCSTPEGALLLDNINLTLAAGQRILLSGPSGSGKSIFSYSIAGLIPLMGDLRQAGSLQVLIDKTFLEVVDISRKARSLLFNKGVSIIFQDAQAALDDQVLVSSFLKDVFKSQHRAYDIDSVITLLRSLGFNTPEIVLSKYPYELSGGQRQRIVIAATLISHPRILIADEATASLDSGTEQLVVQSIIDYCSTQNIALIFISHELNMIDQIDPDAHYTFKDKKIIPAVAIHYEWLKKTKSDDFDGVIFKAENISIEYGQSIDWQPNKSKVVLDHFSLEIKEKEILGIYGPSGAGKSSFALAMAGLIPIKNGQFYYRDELVENVNPYQRHPIRESIVYIPQDALSSFHPYYTIDQQMKWSYRIYRNQTELINILSIDFDWFNYKPDQLSGGQRQRLMLFRALLNNPSILICDEVISGLDPDLKKDTLDALLLLREKKGLTIILISHDLKSLAYVADRLIEIKSAE